MECMIVKEKLDVEDAAEYEQIISEMAEKLNDASIAKKGQEFHRKVSAKYGKETAEEMTKEMMNRILEARLARLLQKHHILGSKKKEVTDGWNQIS